MESKSSAEKFREMNPDTTGELVGDEEEAIKRYRAEMRLRIAEQCLADFDRDKGLRDSEWLKVEEVQKLLGYETKSFYEDQRIKPIGMEGEFASFDSWTQWVNDHIRKRLRYWPPSYKEAVRLLSKPTV